MAFVMAAAERREYGDFAGVAGLYGEICEGGEMLAVNKGKAQLGFALCTRCGYADSERASGLGRMQLPPGFEKHIPLDSWGRQACWSADEAPVFRSHHLAATQVTDILQLDFSGVEHGGLTPAVVTTLGHALRLAGAELLELDHRELGSLACPVGARGRLGLLVFDDVAGGAGHVVELASTPTDWVNRALLIMRRGPVHDDSCTTACLECLLTASSQVDMEAGRLQRREARNVLIDLIAGAPPAPPLARLRVNGAHGRSAAERLRRARDRAKGAGRRAPR
jgi:hypothetical protein